MKSVEIQPGQKPDFFLPEEIKSRLMEYYGAGMPVIQLGSYLATLKPFIEPLSQKVVLDLGCGSTAGSYDLQISRREFEPWVCRALHLLGVKAIGVDIGDLSKEQFEHYSRDLLDPSALSMIADSSVDVVHARLLFSSPQLEHSRIPYELQALAHKEALIPGGERDSKARTLEHVLLPQIERVLKPEGVFIYIDGQHLRTPYYMQPTK